VILGVLILAGGAARHEDKLLLGSITEPRVLVRQLSGGESL